MSLAEIGQAQHNSYREEIALSPHSLSLACDFKKKTKNLTKLPGLSESASLSHKHLNRRMSVHPQKMNSLNTVGALSEFI